MGQEEVRLVLSKRGDWMLAREIAKELDLSIGTIFRCLSVLHKNKEIEKDKAIKVIKDKNRLKNVLGHVYAYRIKEKQEDLEESLNKSYRKNISNITSMKLKSLPLKKK